jgi:hypothetical protein
MFEKTRRSNRPRKSSPKGMQARLDARIAAFVPEIQKGGAGTQRHVKPGSLNPRKH